MSRSGSEDGHPEIGSVAVILEAVWLKVGVVM